jgi:methylthioribose-1-phosphate isomerase
MNVTPIAWTGSELVLLDQRRLPLEEHYVRCRSAAEVAEAIRSMTVRGAPAIGVCAAFGLVLAAAGPPDRLRHRVREAADLLRASRPTAVNLQWALDRMLGVADRTSGDLVAALRGEAETIFHQDIEANRRIGRYGAELLGSTVTVLTHCNAGALATAGYGTALGVIRAAREAGKKVSVYADETRPYLQGARLTAWELHQEGIDVTLITDSMAGHFFQQKKFDAVLVGADRIAANGDTANKIGTYTLAVLANAHGIPFYIAAPTSTIDARCPTGAEIPIEERAASEVLTLQDVRIAPEGVPARHPAFDVTPAGLISAIITDRGVLRAPYLESIAALWNS